MQIGSFINLASEFEIVVEKAVEPVREFVKTVSMDFGDDNCHLDGNEKVAGKSNRFNYFR